MTALAFGLWIIIGWAWLYPERVGAWLARVDSARRATKGGRE